MRRFSISAVAACMALGMAGALAPQGRGDGSAGARGAPPFVHPVEGELYPDGSSEALMPPWVDNPDCYFAIALANPFPWNDLAATIRRDPSRAGTRVVAAATLCAQANQ